MVIPTPNFICFAYKIDRIKRLRHVENRRALQIKLQRLVLLAGRGEAQVSAPAAVAAPISFKQTLLLYRRDDQRSSARQRL